VRLAQARDVVQDYNAVLEIQDKQDWLDAVAPPSARSDMWPEAFLEELKKDIADLSISRTQKIIQNYDQAISITPNAAEPLILRGFSFFQQDDYIRAIDDFTEAVRLLKDSNAPSMMLGFTHYLRGIAYTEFEDSGQSDSDLSVQSASDLVAAMELLPPEDSGRWDELKSSYAERFASRDTVAQGRYYDLALEALSDLRSSLYGGPRNLNAFFRHLRRIRWG
jgi:tetratricopeptide (TPR) repeat protein